MLQTVIYFSGLPLACMGNWDLRAPLLPGMCTCSLLAMKGIGTWSLGHATARVHAHDEWHAAGCFGCAL